MAVNKTQRAHDLEYSFCSLPKELKSNVCKQSSSRRVKHPSDVTKLSRINHGKELSNHAEADH